MQGILHINDRAFEIETKTEGDQIIVSLDGQEFPVKLQTGDDGYIAVIGDETLHLPLDEQQALSLQSFQATDIIVDDFVFGTQFQIRRNTTNSNASLDAVGSEQDANEITAFMPGSILKIFVEEGQKIQSGDILLVLEAMKMENEIKAPFDCVISKIHVKEGTAVNKGSHLISLEKTEELQ